MGAAIIVSSAKGGVGKTNTIVNVGAALAKQGVRVALVDGSLTTPDVSLHLGIPFHVRGLAHILQENAPLESAVFHHSSGMAVLPGNIHLNVLKEFEGKQFKKLMSKLKKEYDVVLVDSAAGIGREALSAMAQCDKMLMVVNPELTSLVNASKAIQVAKKHKVKPIGVILNRVGRHGNELSEGEIIPLLHKVPLLGSIPEDSRVPKAIKKSVTLVESSPYSGLAKQYKQIAQALPVGKKRTPSPPQQSLFSRIVAYLNG